MNQKEVAMAEDRRRKQTLAVIAIILSLIALGISVKAMLKADDYYYTDHAKPKPVEQVPDDTSDNLMYPTGQPPTQ